MGAAALLLLPERIALVDLHATEAPLLGHRVHAIPPIGVFLVALKILHANNPVARLLKVPCAMLATSADFARRDPDDAKEERLIWMLPLDHDGGVDLQLLVLSVLLVEQVSYQLLTRCCATAGGCCAGLSLVFIAVALLASDARTDGTAARFDEPVAA